MLPLFEVVLRSLAFAGDIKYTSQAIVQTEKVNSVEKTEVVEFFGGCKDTAYALDLTTNAVYQWPDELGKRLIGQVIVAAIKSQGIDKTRRQWPEQFQRIAS